ncbi:hypothetical protein VTI74DRAFT_10701 [Chaetomium olivicolor]
MFSEKTSTLTTRRAEWSVESWRSMPVHMQQVVYKDERLLEEVLSRLSELPPLVKPEKIEAARQLHAAAARGEAFLLVGGDCAESFDDTKDDIFGRKLGLLVNQAQYIDSVTGLPVHITARLAGQYSKPRSQLMETLPDGRQVHAFREDVFECVDKSLLMDPASDVKLGGEGYRSLCDPRLSGSEVQAFAERVADMLAAHGTSKKRLVKSQKKSRFFMPMFERALCFFAAPVASNVGGA